MFRIVSVDKVQACRRRERQYRRRHNQSRRRGESRHGNHGITWDHRCTAHADWLRQRSRGSQFARAGAYLPGHGESRGNRDTNQDVHLSCHGRDGLAFKRMTAKGMQCDI